MQSDNVKHLSSADVVYLTHFRALFQHVRWRTQNIDLTHDLMQELYIRIRQKENWDEVKDQSAYLKRVADNLVCDNYRNKKRSEEYLVKASFLDSEASEYLEKTFEKRQQIQTYQKALKELPEVCQLIFKLNRIDGLTHAEIAKELNISISWVEKNIIKAMKHCRNYWHRVSQ